MLNEERITMLEAKGFKRWQKGNVDRLYINASQLGLTCVYYSSGNVRDATFGGSPISNSEARRMKAAKTFIDVKTEQVYSDNQTLKNAAEVLAGKSDS